MRYNADDDTMTLGEMLRQERFGAGMADQKDLDAQFAKAIIGDGKFQVSFCITYNITSPISALRMILITSTTTPRN